MLRRHKENKNNDHQDDVIVLIHKMYMTGEISIIKNSIDWLKNIIEKAVKTANKNERRFFISNVDSLSKYINSSLNNI